MKKALFLCSLITAVIFSQPAFATSEATTSGAETAMNEKVAETVSASPKATSNASIGFSTKNIKEDSTTTVPTDTGGTTKSSSRYPSTGETVGMGLSALGLLLIIIIFRKELKGMIENRKRIKGEHIK